MKKIYSVKERLICILTILLFSAIAAALFINYNSKAIFMTIAYTCIVFVSLALLKLFSFPSHITINNNRMNVFDFPLLATNKFFDKKRSLILWNNEIDISEVKKVELIKLTKEEQKKHVGYNHLSNKYLKLDLKYDHPKYVYAGYYSKHQIRNIMQILSDV